jgi:hypothetical protein
MNLKRLTISVHWKLCNVNCHEKSNRNLDKFGVHLSREHSKFSTQARLLLVLFHKREILPLSFPPCLPAFHLYSFCGGKENSADLLEPVIKCDAINGHPGQVIINYKCVEGSQELHSSKMTAVNLQNSFRELLGL